MLLTFPRLDVQGKPERMPYSKRQILARHRGSLRGRLRACRLHSSALGIRKPYFVYEPPGWRTQQRLPLLYLFRGHEREWVNIGEDASRRATTAIEDLDERIAEGLLPPMVVVIPGLNSTNNYVPSLGIDMAGTWPEALRGLGTGQFWRFLVHELVPRIARDYPETHGGRRLAAGFSLGGYTVSLLATRCPGYFDHAGIYDGLFMWPDHRDPREATTDEWNDPIWCRSPLFDAALGKPRKPAAMRRWNPTDTLRHADGDLLTTLRKTTFWITSGPSDGQRGNVDRARFFVALLRERGIRTGFDEIVLDPTASHTWHWTDRFLIRFVHHALAYPAAPDDLFRFER